MMKTNLVQQTEQNASKIQRLKTSRSGLVNLGNTCYLNSVMQCLLQCELLLRELYSPMWLSRDSDFKQTMNHFLNIMTKSEGNVPFSPEKAMI